MTNHLVLWSISLAASVAISSGVGAQHSGPAPIPHRTQRILAVGNVAFLGQWEPLVTAGGLWQLSLTRTRVGVDEFGAPRITPPKWYLHTLVSGGASFDPPSSNSDTKFVAHGQLGAARRTDTAITAWGGIVHLSSSPRSYGGAVRLEVMDNLGLEAGWVRLQPSDRDRLFVSVDYFKKLCEDLGFGLIC